MIKQGFQPSNSLFRANDIRGVALGESATLTPEFAFHLGQAFGTFLWDLWENDSSEKPPSPIWLCRDARLSSPDLHAKLLEGLLKAGVDVIDLGIGPTPLICHATATSPEPYELAKSGIMITASHNPSDHNGFKIIVNNKPFFGDDLLSLRDVITAGHYHQGDGTLRHYDHQPAYIADLQSRVQNLSESGKPPKIVVDAANGAAGVLATQSLEAVGAEVMPLFCEMDGRFPNHSPDTSDPENLAELVKQVKLTNAFCGIALDGDGDRMVAVTETGKILNADELMALFCIDVLNNNSSACIVFDVKTSIQLTRFISGRGGHPMMTKSGRSHIQSAMQSQKASLAGEFSCHFFFGDRWHGSDDGIYAAARLLEICHKLDQPLSQVATNLDTTHATDEIGIPVSDERKFGLVQEFATNAKFDGANLVTIDGLRIEYPTSWALVRASNTSAKLTLRFEADSQTELHELMSLVRQQLENLEPTLDLRKLNVS